MFNKGDVIVCKDNERGFISITIDKEYVVLKSDSYGVSIVNDNGSTQDYLSERFVLKKDTSQIKLEVGKTYLTAGDYVVHITAMSPVRNDYYATIECSPGINSSKLTIKELLASGDHSRQGDYKKYGWAYRSDGTINLGNEWSEKLRVTREISKLQPAPEGFRYKDGFPQMRSPKKNEWYMGCMDGHAIQASYDEAKTLTRIILEKEGSKMPPYPTMPEGFKFASDPPEHRKPKKGEWFIGSGNKPDFTAVDFLNNAYYIIAKIEEKVSESYPKYYETSDRKRYAYRERVSENRYRVVYIDGRLGELVDWNNRGRSIDDVELHKDVAIGRLSFNKVANTPAPPKITNLCVEVSSMTPEAQNVVAKPAPKQSRLSYWITEPVGNMFGAAKKSARYVVASSLLAVVGYTAFNPMQTFNFVGSCLPKIHVKFGSEPPKFVPINDIPVVPAEWGNKNVGSP